MQHRIVSIRSMSCCPLFNRTIWKWVIWRRLWTSNSQSENDDETLFVSIDDLENSKKSSIVKMKNSINMRAHAWLPWLKRNSSITNCNRLTFKRNHLSLTHKSNNCRKSVKETIATDSNFTHRSPLLLGVQEVDNVRCEFEILQQQLSHWMPCEEPVRWTDDSLFLFICLFLFSQTIDSLTAKVDGVRDELVSVNVFHLNACLSKVFSFQRSVEDEISLYVTDAFQMNKITSSQ